MIFLTVTLILAVLIETAIFIVALTSLSKKLEAIKTDRQNFMNDILRNLQLYTDEVQDYEIRRDKIVKDLNTSIAQVHKEYKNTNSAYQDVAKEAFRALLEELKLNDTRYSDVFDQLAFANKKLDRIEERMPKIEGQNIQIEHLAGYQKVYDPATGSFVHVPCNKIDIKSDFQVSPKSAVDCLCEYWSPEGCTLGEAIEDHTEYFTNPDAQIMSPEEICEYYRVSPLNYTLGICTYVDMLEYQKEMAEKENSEDKKS